MFSMRITVGTLLTVPQDSWCGGYRMTMPLTAQALLAGKALLLFAGVVEILLMLSPRGRV